MKQYRTAHFGVIRLRVLAIMALAMILAASISSPAFAQYKVTNLVSNQNGVAPVTDGHLLNAWGLVSFPFTPFWVNDNAGGVATLYNGAGQIGPLVVAIPSAAGGPGQPTGIVANGTGEFVVTEGPNSGSAFFLFAALDGTISGWSPAVDLNNAILAVPGSGAGAVYTGLTAGSTSAGNFIYAADDGPNRRIDVFDGNFKPKVFSPTAFTDPGIPKDYAPYGIRNINGHIWVTYTALTKAQDGFVDEFDTEGMLLKHFAAHGPLHSPWGIALAPPDFGPMSNAILISNNTARGRINAFDPNTGQFLGPLRDAHGKVIEIDQLWGLSFGGDGMDNVNGAHNQLFFTGGPNNYANGIFGVITFGQ
jgi:uncharacterized protein (TIGR03118 family)